MDAHAHDDHRFEHVRIQHRRRIVFDRPRDRRLAGYTKRSLATITFSDPESRSTYSAQSVAQLVRAEPDSGPLDQSWFASAHFILDRTARAPDRFSDVVDTCARRIDGYGDASRAGLGQQRSNKGSRAGRTQLRGE